jgi:allantoicase
MKNGGGSGTAVLIVLGLMMAGCATTMAPETSTAEINMADISGRWEGTWRARESYGSDVVVLNLTQHGAEVAGSIKTGNFSGPVSGALAGNTFTFTSPGTQIDGTLTVKGNRMSGDFARPVGTGYRGDAQLTRKQ